MAFLGCWFSLIVALERVDSSFDGEKKCSRPNRALYKFCLFPKRGSLLIDGVYQDGANTDRFRGVHDLMERVLKQVLAQPFPLVGKVPR